ncbi:glucans biosynthesis glucosyltransferase H [Marinobacterium nitratireducens]|uniref:Glucans biosynthesis glucosyltransferase H n=1 Tax=Marinobacterium nitratireducens TaxID=518897 RepID=A0A917ZI20_9GAMM|nr:glucans biosynthesis glucosyltransferase MdoH [Marinobacterium nitratireducens]GGO83705.1 glucans biosynthesis glucosyltransferase H [Marinobacterium nitratireducens]
MSGPARNLDAAVLRPARWRLRAWLRRTLLTLIVVSQALVGAYYMASVLPYHGGNLLEQALIALFTLLFTWISIGFWIGLYGFWLRRIGGDPKSLLRRYPDSVLADTPLARTAVVMPIYNEPVNRCLGGLRAIYRSLERSGQIQHFDFYILSDSRDPDVWLSEQAAWQRLCDELGASGRLFYRRRTLNMNYKSGNVADFLRRWGRAYEYMAVMDADSLMEGDTLVKMVRLMQCEPRVGILQSCPTIINGQSLFARVQQFANQVYGPLFSTGLAAMQLGEAAFWGHNALIRTEPFMRHCGLPHLRGPGLFSGPIASHDFVEAAFMGRAGYEVWLEPDLGGSYEESPPSLVDELTRDKRWAKGNLQHLWLMLFERRLRMAHRMAFLNGILSYVASPLWFAFLVLTTIETTKLVLWPPNYFPDQHSLFPLWPEWHPEWAIGLATSVVFLLFFPKLLALIDVLLSGRRRAHGGFFRLLLSTIGEILVSALLAPIRMLAHTRYVLEALFNVTLRWAGQNRSDETTWTAALLSQAPGSLVAAAWSGFAFWLDPMFFIWSLPVALPLLLAAPTSVILSRTGLGQALRRAGILLVPEEKNGSPLLADLAGHSILPEPGEGESAVVRAVLDPVMNRVHQATARSHGGGAKHQRLKQLRQHCLDHGPDSLSRAEKNLLLTDRESLGWLHARAWRAPIGSFWGQAIDNRIRRIWPDS